MPTNPSITFDDDKATSSSAFAMQDCEIVRVLNSTLANVAGPNYEDGLEDLVFKNIGGSMIAKCTTDHCDGVCQRVTVSPLPEAMRECKKTCHGMTHRCCNFCMYSSFWSPRAEFEDQSSLASKPYDDCLPRCPMNVVAQLERSRPVYEVVVPQYESNNSAFPYPFPKGKAVASVTDKLQRKFDHRIINVTKKHQFDKWAREIDRQHSQEMEKLGSLSSGLHVGSEDWKKGSPQYLEPLDPLAVSAVRLPNTHASDMDVPLNSSSRPPPNCTVCPSAAWAKSCNSFCEAVYDECIVTCMTAWSAETGLTDKEACYTRCNQQVQAIVKDRVQSALSEPSPTFLLPEVVNATSASIPDKVQPLPCKKPPPPRPLPQQLKATLGVYPRLTDRFAGQMFAAPSPAEVEPLTRLGPMGPMFFPAPAPMPIVAAAPAPSTETQQTSTTTTLKPLGPKTFETIHYLDVESTGQKQHSSDPTDFEEFVIAIQAPNAPRIGAIELDELETDTYSIASPSFFQQGNPEHRGVERRLIVVLWIRDDFPDLSKAVIYEAFTVLRQQYLPPYVQAMVARSQADLTYDKVYNAGMETTNGFPRQPAVFPPPSSAPVPDAPASAPIPANAPMRAPSPWPMLRAPSPMSVSPPSPWPRLKTVTDVEESEDKEDEESEEEEEDKTSASMLQKSDRGRETMAFEIIPTPEALATIENLHDTGAYGWVILKIVAGDESLGAMSPSNATNASNATYAMSGFGPNGSSPAPAEMYTPYWGMAPSPSLAAAPGFGPGTKVAAAAKAGNAQPSPYPAPAPTPGGVPTPSQAPPPPAPARSPQPFAQGQAPSPTADTHTADQPLGGGPSPAVANATNGSATDTKSITTSGPASEAKGAPGVAPSSAEDSNNAGTTPLSPSTDSDGSTAGQPGPTAAPGTPGTGTSGATAGAGGSTSSGSATGTGTSGGQGAGTAAAGTGSGAAGAGAAAGAGGAGVGAGAGAGADTDANIGAGITTTIMGATTPSASSDGTTGASGSAGSTVPGSTGTGTSGDGSAITSAPFTTLATTTTSTTTTTITFTTTTRPNVDVINALPTVPPMAGMPTATTTTTTANCVVGERLAVDGDCQQYQECIAKNGTFVKVPCAAATAFDVNMQVCTDPYEVAGCEDYAPDCLSGNTGGTCAINVVSTDNCNKARGPTSCINGICHCKSGWCAIPEDSPGTRKGTCISGLESFRAVLKPGTTECAYHTTDGTCSETSPCEAWRGPTECKNGQCVCKDGTCAAEDGRCLHKEYA
eukprot:CAMPEP_0169361552 /NCGR_PEP_ID=MMETSP1017-20121227/30411_1 /TAXON_ID=342587 /ORGANISM="Karlodinium micrum, Strain CCMP2283" /LENGTH=1269 /DNA_ID=CAMNT_0009458963 /DNA_START=37 /DNA_END=3848 /DNA_ORIENTATION=+